MIEQSEIYLLNKSVISLFLTAWRYLRLQCCWFCYWKEGGALVSHFYPVCTQCHKLHFGLDTNLCTFVLQWLENLQFWNAALP